MEAEYDKIENRQKTIEAEQEKKEKENLKI